MNNYMGKIGDTVTESMTVKSDLLELCGIDIEEIGLKLAEICMNGGKILFCGNGGSAADAQHLAAELVVRLRSKINRPAIGGLALTVDPSIMTAGGNDIGFENVFARGVEAYGKKGDALIGISTSGESENVFKALLKANDMGLTTIGLLGCSGGKIKDACNYSIVVPSNNTPRIQESHIMIGHIWCEIIEEEMFPELFIEN
ncbi:MAG: SIS domain-containing protein [Candidatus Kapabacteria bacterium]|nr:SIS domain-containing protein [Candidatus Kapabacteria bacterium]